MLAVLLAGPRVLPPAQAGLSPAHPPPRHVRKCGPQTTARSSCNWHAFSRTTPSSETVAVSLPARSRKESLALRCSDRVPRCRAAASPFRTTPRPSKTSPPTMPSPSRRSLACPAKRGCSRAGPLRRYRSTLPARATKIEERGGAGPLHCRGRGRSWNTPTSVRGPTERGRRAAATALVEARVSVGLASRTGPPTACRPRHRDQTRTFCFRMRRTTQCLSRRRRRPDSFLARPGAGTAPTRRRPPRVGQRRTNHFEVTTARTETNTKRPPQVVDRPQRHLRPPPWRPSRADLPAGQSRCDRLQVLLLQRTSSSLL